MANNRLKLNENKTQVIWLGTHQQFSKITAQSLTLLNATVQFTNNVNDLGILLDSQLTMADHISALSRSCFFQLRQLRSIKQSLTLEATKTLVHAFVSSRLDYCNSMLAGVSGQLLHRLQVIQNAAACRVTGVWKYERMTPVLRSLHWLPVRQRITFKTAVIVFKCFHGQAPLYLTKLCRPIIIRRWASSSSFGIHSSADRSTYENKLRRPQLLCSRSLCVERSAERLAVIGHVVRNI